MQRYELDAWLGDSRADLTDEQYDRLLGEAREIADRYPGPDGEQWAAVALAAALAYITGDLSPQEAGTALLRARIAEREASVTAQEVARLTVLDGSSEVAAARMTGLDRMTVRKALGK